MTTKPGSTQDLVKTEPWTGPGGRTWVRGREQLDAQLAVFVPLLIDSVAPPRGARVLEVGCGTGALARAVARQLGEGSVLGVDLSAPLIDRALAMGDRPANLEFRCVDAATHDFGTDTFDVILSRFGVTFSEDPVAAFGNLARCARSGAKLGFVSWRAVEHNDWMTVPERAVAPLIGPPPVPAAGPPGAVAFRDRSTIESLLAESGWTDVSVNEVRVPLYVGGPGSVDDAVDFMEASPRLALALAALDPALRDEARGVLRGVAETHFDGTGVKLDSGCWLVRARRAP